MRGCRTCHSRLAILRRLRKERTTEEFMQIAAAGGNLVIDAAGKNVDEAYENCRGMRRKP
jgi:hypothetical protein